MEGHRSAEMVVLDGVIMAPAFCFKLLRAAESVLGRGIKVY